MGASFEISFSKLILKRVNGASTIKRRALVGLRAEITAVLFIRAHTLRKYVLPERTREKKIAKDMETKSGKTKKSGKMGRRVSPYSRQGTYVFLSRLNLYKYPSYPRVVSPHVHL